MQARGQRPRREAYFLQVKSTDQMPYFANNSAELGRPARTTNPLASCALRVSDAAVLFSMLKLSKRSREQLLAKPLALPAGALARLERKAEGAPAELTANDLLLEINDASYKLTVTRDENNVASLEMADGFEDTPFELPKTEMRITMLTRGPRGMLVALGWSGFLNKPGTPETPLRAAAYALNHTAGLAEFQIIAGIAKVKVPAPIGKYTIAAPARRAEDEVRFDVPVRLWDETGSAQLAAGVVGVHVDLDSANPVSGRLLLNLTPSKEIADGFETYRMIFDDTVSKAFVANLGQAALNDVIYEIVLSEVGQGSLERLREAAATVPGLDLTPKQAATFKL